MKKVCDFTNEARTVYEVFTPKKKTKKTDEINLSYHKITSVPILKQKR